MLRDLPDRPQILDIGCGPGLQTMELVQRSNGHVVGLDFYESYLSRLKAKAELASLQDRIDTLQGSMFDIRLPDQSIDLIWAEGSIYIIGFEKGLREWQRLIRPKGYLAATHLSWLTPDIPDEPKRFWAEKYPAITSVENNLAIAESAGYDNVGHFTLPESAWWNDYYKPLENRLAELGSDLQFTQDPIAQAAMAGTKREIDLYRQYPEVYGYVFYVLRRR